VFDSRKLAVMVKEKGWGEEGRTGGKYFIEKERPRTGKLRKVNGPNGGAEKKEKSPGAKSHPGQELGEAESEGRSEGRLFERGGASENNRFNRSFRVRGKGGIPLRESEDGHKRKKRKKRESLLRSRLRYRQDRITG